jgi:hypothetical protein
MPEMPMEPGMDPAMQMDPSMAGAPGGTTAHQ